MIFEKDAKYTVSFIGDADLKPTITILKRTSKTVTILNTGKQEQRCKIHTYNGEEYLLPYGSYSMAPSVQSKRVEKVKTEVTAKAQPKVKLWITR